MANLKSETLCRQKKYRVDFPNLWGVQQPLDLMGCHMVRMKGDMGSTTMMLNPRASFEKHCDFEQKLKNNLPKNTCVLPTALTSRIHSNCWREFCAVSCFIILKRGHYLCIVFISYFCQPQNVKQSVIAGIMGQRSPTSTGSLAVSAPGSDFTITSQQTEQE